MSNAKALSAEEIVKLLGPARRFEIVEEPARHCSCFFHAGFNGFLEIAQARDRLVHLARVGQDAHLVERVIRIVRLGRAMHLPTRAASFAQSLSKVIEAGELRVGILTRLQIEDRLDRLARPVAGGNGHRPERRGVADVRARCARRSAEGGGGLFPRLVRRGRAPPRRAAGCDRPAVWPMRPISLRGVRLDTCSHGPRQFGKGLAGPGLPGRPRRTGPGRTCRRGTG